MNLLECFECRIGGPSRHAETKTQEQLDAEDENPSQIALWINYLG